MALTVDSSTSTPFEWLGATSGTKASPWVPANFTNTAGTVLYAFVQLDLGSSVLPATGIGLTYNSVSMTLLGSGSSTATGNTRGWNGLFRLTAAASLATGSNAFSLSWTGGSIDSSGAAHIGAISFTGNHTTPDSGTATVNTDVGGLGTTWTAAVTGTTAGNIVIAGFAFGDPTGTTSSPAVNIYPGTGNGTSYTNNVLAQYTTSSGGTVTSTATGTTSTSWVAVGIEVLTAAVVAGPVAVRRFDARQFPKPPFYGRGRR